MSSSATGLGLAAGLIISGLTVATMSVAPDANSSPSRPESVPAEATWLADAFGQPGWVLCAPAGKGVRCQAFGLSGAEVFSGSYVPAGKKVPSAPIDHVVAADVERVWINKVKMVPDGEVSFPHAGVKILYDAGQRRTEP